MKTLSRLLLVLGVCCLLFTGLAAKSLAFDPLGGACTSAAAKKTVACQDSAANNAKGNPNPVYHIINVAADIIAVIGGIAGVITIIIGGMNYVTSGGNSESVTKGKNRIIGAIIGLVIIALAWTIVSFGIKLLE